MPIWIYKINVSRTNSQAMLLCTPSQTNAKEGSKSFARDFALEISAAISKTSTAPIERIKILISMQIVNGRFTQYTGIIGCARKAYHDKGLSTFCKGQLY